MTTKTSYRISKRQAFFSTLTPWLLALVCVMGTGCAVNPVSLMSNPETTRVFEELRFDPDQYVFYTMGAEDAPEAILLIDMAHMSDFHSTGWNIADRDDVMQFLKSDYRQASSVERRGYPVVDNKGHVKGMLYTSLKGVKVITEKWSPTFKIATPANMEP